MAELTVLPRTSQLGLLLREMREGKGRREEGKETSAH